MSAPSLLGKLQHVGEICVAGKCAISFDDVVKMKSALSFLTSTMQICFFEVILEKIQLFHSMSFFFHPLMFSLLTCSSLRSILTVPLGAGGGNKF